MKDKNRLPTITNIHQMDDKSCPAPENVLVEEGGNYSQNSMIQDISYQWKRLFLMHCHHEFFDASPSIVPK